ncbi:MAG: NAD-dependent epimerase/dehydratase family protein, partial [Verrucomicrobiota bacterium]|nr:NAD-dependent epimerase/dehydratase family protein [Verrucomicrobiota bacterium]
MTTSSKKIVIPGGGGFIGRHLTRYFADKGWEVVVLSRRRNERQEGARFVWWDGANLDAWVDELDGSDAVINLAGRTVNCRYNKKNRRQIYESRQSSTEVIDEAIADCAAPPSVWFNASSATVYRHSLDRAMDEATGDIDPVEPGKPRDKWEFSVDVVNRWEAALFDAPTPDTRRIAMRLSMVFGSGKGGVYEAFRNIARFGLAGTQGQGNQYVSWLHVTDLLRMIDWCIENENLEGAINMCAPNPIPNREFLKDLREASGARFGLPATWWMLEIGAFFM